MINLTFSVWSTLLVTGALFSMYITSPLSASNSEEEYPPTKETLLTVSVLPVGVPVAEEVAPVIRLVPENAV